MFSYQAAKSRRRSALPLEKRFLAYTNERFPEGYANGPPGMLNFSFSHRRSALEFGKTLPCVYKKTSDGTLVNTLWGELAWQLLGKEGYTLVADADRQGVSPGTALTEILKRSAPCLVLIDEWVAYARQLYGKDNRLCAGI